MKKLKYFLILLFAVILGTVSTQNVFADDSSVIDSPDKKSCCMSPGWGDTYFTYYSSITGYKSNGYWGFYDKYRSVNIPPMYSDIKGLNSKYILVKQNGVWGLIDTNGNQLILPKYDNISTFSLTGKEAFLVKQYGVYGVVDRNDVQLVPMQYSSISALQDGYVEIVQNYKHGVYSIPDREEVISPSYDDIKMLKQWFMYQSNNKWGILDRNEKVFVNAKYDDIKWLNNSYFTVKNNKIWGVVDLNGKEVIPPKYEKIEVGKGQYLKVKHGGKWGACRYNGEIVIPTNKGPFEINKLLKQLN